MIIIIITGKSALQLGTLKNVFIRELAYVLPEQEMSSAEIEDKLFGLYKKFNLHPGRLEFMTGVRSRRLWPIQKKASDIATLAAKKLLAKFPQKERIDLLIHASVCRDYLEPATASFVHRNLSLSKNCGFMDLSNACLGILDALALAAHLIEGKVIRNALVVGGENSAGVLSNTIKGLVDKNADSDKEGPKESDGQFYIGLWWCGHSTRPSI